VNDDVCERVAEVRQEQQALAVDLDPIDEAIALWRVITTPAQDHN